MRINLPMLPILALLTIATNAAARGANVSDGGVGLSIPFVPPPGAQGYVLYAFGLASGTNSTTPIGLSSSGNLASPAPHVTINTTGDQFYTQSDSIETYSTLTANGTSGPTTGVAYQAVGSAGNSAILATLTLQTGVPSTFRLGILADNAPQPQNAVAAIEVAGQNAVTSLVAGNATGPHNDFYFFDISNAAPGDSLTIRVTNGGSSSGFAYAELGGFTFDAVPEPEPTALLAGAVMLFSLGMRRDRSQSERNA